VLAAHGNAFEETVFVCLEGAPSDDGIKTWIVDVDRDVVSADLPGLRMNSPKAGYANCIFGHENHRFSPKRGGFGRCTRPLGFGLLTS
jgi:hypothetical protein